jgi:hypothetical protein
MGKEQIEHLLDEIGLGGWRANLHEYEQLEPKARL